MTPTKADRERLKELRAQATPGPWAAADIDGQIVVERQACSQVVTRDGRQVAECFYVTNPPPGHGTPDVRLIVAAVNALPSLLAAIDGLEAENERLRRASEVIGEEVGPLMRLIDTGCQMTIFKHSGNVARGFPGIDADAARRVLAALEQ